MTVKRRRTVSYSLNSARGAVGLLGGIYELVEEVPAGDQKPPIEVVGVGDSGHKGSEVVELVLQVSAIFVETYVSPSRRNPSVASIPPYHCGAQSAVSWQSCNRNAGEILHPSVTLRAGSFGGPQGRLFRQAPSLTFRAGPFPQVQGGLRTGCVQDDSTRFRVTALYSGRHRFVQDDGTGARAPRLRRQRRRSRHALPPGGPYARRASECGILGP